MKHVGPVRRNAYLASWRDSPAMLVRHVAVGTMQNFSCLLADKPLCGFSKGVRLSSLLSRIPSPPG